MSSLGGGPPLDEGDLPAAIPEPDDPADRSRVGTDEWVARVDERRTAQKGLTGAVARAWERLPAAGRLVVLLGPFAIFPFITNEGNLYRYGLITIIYALLALGLNVVVGFAGLLDLGYVAFFGFGAYLYGIMASGHSGHHLQAEIAIPIVVVSTALLGLLLGLTSWRLLGDYLAIVTLFFLQAFVIFVNNANGGLNDFSYPFVGKVDLTGGANGLDRIDPFNLFGYHITTTKGYYFFTLISITLLMTMLYFVNNSRTGRAWRALREDPLAAEVMSMPVNKLKLLAFVFGAGTAGLCGTVFAAIQTGTVAGNFDVSLLITIYAIVILGGMGSIAGVILGAIVINVSFQFLAPSNDHPELKRWLFYGALLVLVTRIRPWARALFVLAGTAGFGFGVHEIVSSFAPSWAAGSAVDAGSAAHAIRDWVVIPHGHGNFNTLAYIALVAAIVGLAQLRGWWRAAGLIPTLYLVAVV